MRTMIASVRRQAANTQFLASDAAESNGGASVVGRVGLAEPGVSVSVGVSV